MEFTHLSKNITMASGWDMLLTVEVLDFYPCFHIFSNVSMCMQNAYMNNNTVEVYFLPDLLEYNEHLVIFDSCEFKDFLQLVSAHKQWV